MGNALMSGVSGLKAHQTMIDVAGNNLANVNTTSFKSSRVTFAELLSQTLKDASAPTTGIGGTNPMQIGNGVVVGSIDRNMSQGSLEYTGNPMDMAIDGNGYFTLNGGMGDRYTRVGQFAVDSEYYLVDPTTGYRVQRTGNEGVPDGFQSATSNDIRIPYDVPLAPKETEEISFKGNLTAVRAGNEVVPTTNKIHSVLKYTDTSNLVASKPTLISDLTQVSGIEAGDTIDIVGTNRAGDPVTCQYVYSVGDNVAEILDVISANFDGATASMKDGEIIMTDDTSGYSRSYIDEMVFTDVSGGTADFEMPVSFDLESAGGQLARTVDVEIFDGQGNSYPLVGSFVRTDTVNKWDFVINEVGCGAVVEDRFVRGIKFQTDGGFDELDGLDPDGNTITLKFPSESGTPKVLSLDLGTRGSSGGLTQYGEASTASIDSQDGCAAGWLSTMSVSSEGTLVGVFTNGQRRDIAALKIATFQNSAGLKSIGGNYFEPSANSGAAEGGKAATGGAGSVSGGSIEKSNVEVAEEFINLIEAQNGYQANARTIKVANEMLGELTNLIR